MKTIRNWAADRYSRTRAFARRQAPYLILLAFLLGFAFLFFFHRIVISVHPGELGVLWRRLGGGTVMETVYREGLHLILPFNEMYLYNIRKQILSDNIDVLTVDGLTVHVKYSIRHYLDSETLPLLHQRVGPDYVNIVVRPEIRSVIRTVFGQYRPEEIYTAQKAIQERVSMISKNHLESRFVSLDDVPIESITLPVRISEAIESKMAQQQREAEYVFRLSIATKEAERLRIEADGRRVFNETLSRSLNPSILQWHGIVATEELAKSNNSKIVVIGAGTSGLPLILGKD